MERQLLQVQAIQSLDRARSREGEREAKTQYKLHLYRVPRPVSRQEAEADASVINANATAHPKPLLSAPIHPNLALRLQPHNRLRSYQTINRPPTHQHHHPSRAGVQSLVLGSSPASLRLR